MSRPLPLRALAEESAASMIAADVRRLRAEREALRARIRRLGPRSTGRAVLADRLVQLTARLIDAELALGDRR